MQCSSYRRILAAAVIRLLAGALVFLVPSCWSQITTNTPGVAPTVSTPGTNALSASPENNAGSVTPNDTVALKFMQVCAGCHTFGGGKLTGPDLIVASTWPKPDLKTNIKRMEEKVGPLGPETIESLADLLKDPRIKERLKGAEAAIARQFAAKMAPGSAVTGRGLFDGSIPLQNGGPACAACHSVDGISRFLGPDLKLVYQKMGETALVGALQKANFKIMEAAFRNRPVTPQEALHLVKYLGSLANGPAIPSQSVPLALLGVGGTVLFFAGMFIRQRQKNYGRRDSLRRRRP